MKLSDARRDQYRKLAKENRYRSRAVYKLSQINKAHSILKKGMNIVDIGAAPGGWLQIISKISGPSGKVIGIDIKEIEPLSNVFIIEGSIEDEGVIEKIINILNGPVADVVVSDLSPNVSGLWEIDHLKQIDLTRKAVEATKKILKENGSAVYKVFQGEETEEFIRFLKTLFSQVFITKPDASRKQSSEIYVVCKKYKSNQSAKETNKSVTKQ